MCKYPFLTDMLLVFMLYIRSWFSSIVSSLCQIWCTTLNDSVSISVYNRNEFLLEFSLWLFDVESFLLILFNCIEGRLAPTRAVFEVLSPGRVLSPASTESQHAISSCPKGAWFMEGGTSTVCPPR